MVEEALPPFAASGFPEADDLSIGGRLQLAEQFGTAHTPLDGTDASGSLLNIGGGEATAAEGDGLNIPTLTEGGLRMPGLPEVTGGGNVGIWTLTGEDEASDEVESDLTEEAGPEAML